MLLHEDCPFCKIDDTVLSNERAFAIFDRDPVTPGHMLIIARRHVADWFDATAYDKHAMLSLAEAAREFLVQKVKPEGFNMGVNCGRAAGQGIFHVHLHLIPRYSGDVEDPLGGVRGVIPARQKY